MTLNEPLTVVQQGYVAGVMAPGRCSKFTNPNCTAGDGAIEPYIVGHNLILAHGAAVKVYREKYKVNKKQDSLCFLVFKLPKLDHVHNHFTPQITRVWIIESLSVYLSAEYDNYSLEYYLTGISKRSSWYCFERGLELALYRISRR